MVVETSDPFLDPAQMVEAAVLHLEKNLRTTEGLNTTPSYKKKNHIP